MSSNYDVVVIGGGPAGENVAWYARDNGLTVALVERELLGGECSYWACIPSKAMLRPGEAVVGARRVPGADAAVTRDVDAGKALAHRDEMVHNLDDSGQVEWVEGTGTALFRGTGRITGERTVTVTTEDGTTTELTAERAVVVATGSGPATPPIDGLDQIDWWDNREVTTTADIPSRVLILGGGPVGVEMAQALRRLGSRDVTIVEMAEQLLPAEEPFAGKILQEALEAEDVRVLTGAKAERVTRDGADGSISLHLADGTDLTADELVVATGRKPRTRDLGLESLGLEPGAAIEVDDQLRATGVDGTWLYAVGDVNGRAPLTHQGKYQARVAADVIAGRDITAEADDVAVPRVVFTDPQVAAVGLTERTARESGRDIETAAVDIDVAAVSLLGAGPTTGRAQLVLDRNDGVVIGATFAGPQVSELLHSATIAIVGRVPTERLQHAVPSFPTVSEVWLRLLEELRGIE